MSIIIYTYHDPYKINKEKFWDEISNCPYFCVSQTLVNGLKSIYGKSFQIGRVTTIKNLTDSLYEFWTSTSCAVKQHADIDNVIINSSNEIGLTDEELDNIRKSFLFNRDEVFSSIRTMFELRMIPQNIVDEYLTPEQRYIVAVFKNILESEKEKDFFLKENFTEEEINIALSKAMNNARKNSNSEGEVEVKDLDHIVIQGVHQFSPLMLRTIEEISKYKKVILLFNYQEQYKNVYQTWVDIYSSFDCKIIDYKGDEFHPIDSSSISYEGNVLAQNMGKLLSGRKEDFSVEKPYKIIEFDNMTEFAGYVARVFEAAERKDPEHPMLAMNEQIYAADSSANDILKVYFPEQFGERQFLNYPLGHFFIAVANMWDSSANGTVISDLNDIRECLSAGILEEETPGRLASTFGKMEALFEGCISVDDMLTRIKKVRKNRKYLSDDKRQEYVSHISYYAVSLGELYELEMALNNLEELASFFYEDFEKRPNNFKAFYKRLKKYLQEEILEDRELGEVFVDIINRVLSRLDEVENIEASASFECLKSTMSLYLVQETKPGKSANWIVRNFEQIDGDVLRTVKEQESSILHFACLTDEDINSVKNGEFSWPLTGEFFEVAQNPVDWKYQVYVKARKEYKNFKRYALIYGLEFNRGKYKLSFVKRDGDQEREPYYLLKILGIKKERNIDKRIKNKLEDFSDINFKVGSVGKYTSYDYYRYRICKQRFLFETLSEGNTVYKDNFLLVKYLEVWLENETKESMQGLPCSEILLLEKLNEIYDEIKKYFPFVLNVNRIDIINNVRNRLNKDKSFSVLSEENRKYMMIRELFIYKQLKDPKKFNQDVLKDKFPDVNQDKIDQDLSVENLKEIKFRSDTNLWCKYCTNREICVAYYANIE
ncbi:hypothetical protein HZF24_12480 [Sedimentibacter hydroxybenzoicus DSM 7310]|uniref:Uncharacterized protein n=1 Tax=Sedimentibacter hydroxybenzoicus DSM 7310 TaxID=1123245 RepID=A0A974BLD1_SEDHY|nr:hypothetical protein [Sedimentibacter hydroxybenzoicus]NYB74956.1 hypothetical protein [Sedimentibacter hydroxybenzoicus DSM 7310]